MPDSAVAAAVADAHRREWAFVLAATVRVTRDIDLAQECVQDAYAQALTTWPARGIPAKPGAWLTTVARRRALNLVRRDATATRTLPLLLGDDRVEAGPEAPGEGPIPDDRLRLIFTCCHPALARQAQVALTLRLLCGLSTAEVARAFLVSEPTMAARITRAKKKITAARIPYRVPPAEELPASTRFSRWCTCCTRPGTPRPPANTSSAATSWSARWTLPGCYGCCFLMMPTSPGYWR